jgi:S-adenosylmethionine synthetase
MSPIVTAMQGPSVAEAPIEIVERKGLGHPDTICDALADAASRALAQHYLERFGAVLHHNVDKILLRGGQSHPAFGGGIVAAPIEIYLGGRATMNVKGIDVPAAEIAIAACRSWLRQNLRYVDVDRHVRLHCLFRPGSPDLVDLFLRRGGGTAPLANDTSVGVGYAPNSPLEDSVLAVERELNALATKHGFAALGDDVKVLGIRRGRTVTLTTAAAIVGAHTASIEEYAQHKARIAGLVGEAAREAAGLAPHVVVNAADDLAAKSVYLTVTGTSADAGDDGQTGRGNRGNGLITPYRPMTMEAIAGKNPINHVGKLYNIVAQRLARAIAAEVPGVIEVECYLAGQIGRPITDPAAIELRLRTGAGSVEKEARQRAEYIAHRQLGGIVQLWEPVLADQISGEDWQDPGAGAFRERLRLVDEIAEEFALTRHLTEVGGMSRRLRTAMLGVPRERYVATDGADCAYDNRPLPIGYGQTISQPFIVALMTELLDLAPQDQVLEIGTGSGYQAAILARLAGRVFSIELVEALADTARTRLAQQGFDNIDVRSGDGSQGWIDRAPFDKIIVTAAAPELPHALLAQLKNGGRLVVPVGAPMREQMLMLVTKSEHGAVREKALLPVAFVPLRRHADIERA